ncbi:hypothetical protein DIE15_13080 [Burkholderia sp. Bp9031]|uniref:hypothetical protein n=1 Tax=Burkholderia sp. Bp9031 TaxID=2184566 RepID=UPI000F5D5AF7|nr:hypothetical protein [Burkholderia sp. Bp9031]RQZ16661.1 hypothetical protein DIE15_13080 [Burkholderia sp. Bp9031]
MTQATSLDTDSQGQDRGDSTPGPEGKRHGTDTPPPRSAHDPAEGKPAPSDDDASAPRPDERPHRTPARERNDKRLKISGAANSVGNE